MENNQIFNCPKCNTPMTTYIDGHCLSVECTNCGYGWATTYHEPIEIDNTIYHIILETGNQNSINEIKIVSKINNCNFVETKKIISNTPIEIFADKAPKVLEIKKLLENNNINFRITPDFKY